MEKCLGHPEMISYIKFRGSFNPKHIIILLLDQLFHMYHCSHMVI